MGKNRLKSYQLHHHPDSRWCRRWAHVISYVGHEKDSILLRSGAYPHKHRDGCLSSHWNQRCGQWLVVLRRPGVPAGRKHLRPRLLRWQDSERIMGTGRIKGTGFWMKRIKGTGFWMNSPNSLQTTCPLDSDSKRNIILVITLSVFLFVCFH